MSLQSSNPTFSYPIIRFQRGIKNWQKCKCLWNRDWLVEGFFIALQLDKLDKSGKNAECAENPTLASACQAETQKKSARVGIWALVGASTGLNGHFALVGSTTPFGLCVPVVGRYMVLAVESNDTSNIPFMPTYFANTSFFPRVLRTDSAGEAAGNLTVASYPANSNVSDVSELVFPRNLHTP